MVTPSINIICPYPCLDKFVYSEIINVNEVRVREHTLESVFVKIITVGRIYSIAVTLWNIYLNLVRRYGITAIWWCLPIYENVCAHNDSVNHRHCVRDARCSNHCHV